MHCEQKVNEVIKDVGLNARINVTYLVGFLFNSDFLGRNYFKKQDWLKGDIWPLGNARLFFFFLIKSQP
jgi:hypothetical protein